MFAKKDSDKGFNKFQIIIANIRSKQKSVQQMYDYAWKALAKSIEQGKKTEIKSKVHSEYRLYQELMFLNEACDLGHIVYKNYKDLFSVHPSKEIQDKYVELCTYREVVKVASLGEFWFQHKIAGDDTAKQITEIDESSIPSYLKRFAEIHGVNQKGMENIDILFPEEDLLEQIPVGMPIVV
jgi:hypothetical protein